MDVVSKFDVFEPKGISEGATFTVASSSTIEVVLFVNAPVDVGSLELSVVCDGTTVTAAKSSILGIVGTEARAVCPDVLSGVGEDDSVSVDMSSLFRIVLVVTTPSDPGMAFGDMVADDELSRFGDGEALPVDTGKIATKFAGTP